MAAVAAVVSTGTMLRVTERLNHLLRGRTDGNRTRCYGSLLALVKPSQKKTAHGKVMASVLKWFANTV